MKQLKDFLRGDIPQEKEAGSKQSLLRPSESKIARTPPSNTGYDSQPKFECAVDWIDFTFRNAGSEGDVEQIIRELEEIASESIDFSFSRSVFNGRLWTGSGRGARGVRVWYDSGLSEDENQEPKPAQLKFSMGGSVMSTVDFPILADWLSWRAGMNELDCTRVDVCVDDKKRLVEMGKITQAKYAGNFFNASYSALQSSSTRGKAEGITVYFGHPSSHKRLRVYDKTVESKGKIKGIRWEAQFRKAVARDVLFTILEKIDDGIKEATDYFKSLVTGLIDFRDRSGDDPNRARCKRLSWFVEFCDALRAEPIRVSSEKPEPLVQRSIDWLSKSVAQSLSVIKHVLGTDFLSYLETTITEGGERLNNRKRDLIARTKRADLIYSTS